MSSLDLSRNSDLLGLECSNNNLTTLDVSNILYLVTLSCNGNRLTSLDLSNNSELFSFEGDDQNYDINVNQADLTFDLNNLPGSFDPVKASNWVGGTVNGTTLTLDSTLVGTVTYHYQARQDRNFDVTLHIANAQALVKPQGIYTIEQANIPVKEFTVSG